MWDAYSANYIRHNKNTSIFIMVTSLLTAMLLSLVSGVFYNFWADQVQQTIAATGTAQVEITPSIIAYVVVFTSASIALILMLHHAFAATMSSRIHQLGILQSVGATPRQIKSALISEVVVLSIPAILVGNLIGIGLCWMFMQFVINFSADFRDYTLTFAYSPAVLLGSIFFSLFTSAVSAWIPARKLSRITPLEAIHYGSEPAVERMRKFRFVSAIFGIHGELAKKSLHVRRKAMRMGTLSILFAVFSFVSLLNMEGISGLSTQKTYFDRFRDTWDFLITVESEADSGALTVESTTDGEALTVEGTGDSEALMQEIRQIEGVESCIVHRLVYGSTSISKGDLSELVSSLGMENLSDRFDTGAEAYTVDVPIFVLDDSSFGEYRGEHSEEQIVAVNIIWDSVNSVRQDRKYIPFLDTSKEILLEIAGGNGTVSVNVSAFSDGLPRLREELEQYSLTLVVSESYYETIQEVFPAEETYYTVRMTDESMNDAVDAQLQALLADRTDCELEGRIEETANDLQMRRGLRMIIAMFAGLMACVGLANVFASTLGQIHQRKREFARYFSLGMTPKDAAKMMIYEAMIVAFRPIILTILLNIPLVMYALDAGGISTEKFMTNVSVVPAIAFFVAVLGFVGLAYYLGGRKINKMILVDAIKDDTLIL